MAEELGLIELAERLAEIAAHTREPETATRLIMLVNEMLASVGLAPPQRGPGSDA